MIPEEFVRLAETLAQAARETARRATNDPEGEIVASSGPRLHERVVEVLSATLQ